MRYRVDYQNRLEDKPKEATLGGAMPMVWLASEADVIKLIDSGKYTFYTKINGANVDIGVIFDGKRACLGLLHASRPMIP